MLSTKPQFLTIEPTQAGQRIDNFLTSRLKGLPKSHLYRIVRKGEVRVNKKRIKPEYRVQTGDVVRIPPLYLEPSKEKPAPSPATVALLESHILWENDSVLVINKPPGMAVHGGSGISLGVIEALRKARPKQPFLELAHRLDRDTSGCLILAKKSSILKEVHALLREGAVKKTYVALVKGRWPAQKKRIDAPLQKFQLQSGERRVVVNEEGKPASTEFKVMQYYRDATLLEVTLLTGRTHQIRVHTAYAGHPIIGDDKYGDKESNKHFRRQGCKRLFLHASALKFALSAVGEVSVKADVDKDLKNFLKSLALAGNNP